jgi:acyl-CoA thioesterase-1
MSDNVPVHRRELIAGAVAAIGCGAAAAKPLVVTILGDSITAGYGLPAAYSLPVQLQAAIRARKPGVVVRGAGVSGDTTAGGLARVNFSVQKDTDLCIVALGGNDLLQGAPIATIKANLTAIVRDLKKRHIKVMLAGIAAPSGIGGAYGREFSAVFPAVAKAEHVAVYPNLLAGVILDERYNQGDGIHPNAAGVKLIARKLAPAVIKAL